MQTHAQNMFTEVGLYMRSVLFAILYNNRCEDALFSVCERVCVCERECVCLCVCVSVCVCVCVYACEFPVSPCVRAVSACRPPCCPRSRRATW